MNIFNKKNLLIVAKVIVTFSLCVFLLSKANWDNIPDLLDKTGLPVTITVSIIMLLSIAMSKLKTLKILKIFISVSLIFAIVYSVELDNIVTDLSKMNIWLVLFAFTFSVIQFPVSTIKWRTALNIHGLYYPFGFLQKILCIGFFFNNFLPSSIGGDGYRVYKTIPDEGYRSRALSAVLLERIAGFAMLLIIGYVGAIVALSKAQSTIVLNYVITASVGMIAFLAAVLFLRLGCFSGFIDKLKKIKKCDIFFHNFGHIKRKKAKLSILIVQSIVFQLIAVLAIYILFHSIGINAGFSNYAFIAALAGIAAVIPLSINGIGIVEGAFVIAAVQVGIDYDQAVIVAIAMRLFMLPSSLICGLVYLFDSYKS